MFGCIDIEYTLDVNMAQRWNDVEYCQSIGKDINDKNTLIKTLMIKTLMTLMSL